jgi:hypothetical protein
VFTVNFLRRMRENGVSVGFNWDAHLCGLELQPEEALQVLEEQQQ